MPGNQWGRPGGELPNPFVGEVERQRKQRAAVVIGGATVAVLVVVGLILAFALGRGSGGDGAAEADAADGPVSGTADRPAELTDTGWEGTSAVCAGDDPWFYAAQGFDTNRVVICLHDEGDPSDPQGRTTYFHDENTEAATPGSGTAIRCVLGTSRPVSTGRVSVPMALWSSVPPAASTRCTTSRTSSSATRTSGSTTPLISRTSTCAPVPDQASPASFVA